MRTSSNRLVLLALAAALAAGCQAAPVPIGTFGLDRDDLGVPVTTTGAAAPVAPAVAAPAATAPPAAPASGGRAQGVAGDPSAYLTVAGASAQDPAGIAVAAYAGEVSIFLDGAVPMSLRVPGRALVVHPRPAGGAPTPSGQAMVAGDVVPAEAGLSVQYMSKGRWAFAGGVTDASGHFAFPVPVDAAEHGLVVARTAEAAPRLAVARVTLAPDAIATAGPLTLVAPSYPAAYRLAELGEAPASHVAAPPAGLVGTGVDLSLLEAGPWRAAIVALGPGASVPDYALPGYTQAVAYAAASPDGLRASETVAPPGASVGWLAPPALDGLPATLKPGAALRWGAVPGARLYTVRLSLPGAENTPVWEGLTSEAAIALPGRLSLSADAVVVRVDAWDDAEVTPYAVAGLRAFRVPDGPLSAGGRHSWSRKTVPFGP